MMAIEPDMVLGKAVRDSRGDSLGDVVDVGLYTHSRVKFLVVEEPSADRSRRVPVRRVGVESIADVSAEAVILRP